MLALLGGATIVVVSRFRVNETKQLQTFSVCERLRSLSSVEKAGNCAVASNCHGSVNGIQKWRNRKIFFLQSSGDQQVVYDQEEKFLDTDQFVPFFNKSWQLRYAV